MTYPNDPYGERHPPPAGGYPPPASAYPQQYGAGYQGYPGYPGPPRTNGMALASLITSAAGLLVCGLACPVGAVLGHVALRQIDRTGEQGRGMAVAGIVIGWTFTALAVLSVVVFALILFGAVASSPQVDLPA